MQNPHGSSPLRYRPDIDGLRALAVVPVILFHAGLPGFAGGYVGVDVFFVISGYLITRLIVAELEAGRFSLLTFYERRARRILPALFAVMLACLPFAWAWMLPAELKNFSQSLVAVTVFASNILFWRETGYFAPAADEKPLLHTWSLAVEEQYYLAFPIFLLLAWRFGRDPVFYLVAAIAAASLLFAELTVRSSPDAAFYLPHTRAWELLAGALCALAQRRYAFRESGPLAALGNGLVLIAVFAFDAATPIPSLYALIPVGGAAIIILFGGSDSYATRFLGAPVLVGIGLISYSAYLWHVPIFAFARLRGLPTDSGLFMIALSLLALAVGWLSWRYIEQPFRYRAKSHRPPLLKGRLPVFALSGAVAALVMAIGLVGNSTDLRYQRYSPEVAEVMRGFDDFRTPMKVYGLRTCFIDYDQTAETLFANDCLVAPKGGGDSVVLYGDSLAAHLSLGVREALPASSAFSHYSGTECAPFRHPRLSARCGESLERFLKAMEAWPNEATVILSANWIEAFDAMDRSDFLAAVDATVARLRNSGHRIVLNAQSPTYQNGGWIRQIGIAGRVEPDARSTADDFRPVNAALKAYAADKGLTVVDSTPLFCKAGSLDCQVTVDGAFVYSDRLHVTPPFSRMIGRLIGDAIEDEPTVSAAL